MRLKNIQHIPIGKILSILSIAVKNGLKPPELQRYLGGYARAGQPWAGQPAELPEPLRKVGRRLSKGLAIGFGGQSPVVPFAPGGIGFGVAARDALGNALRDALGNALRDAFGNALFTALLAGFLAVHCGEYHRDSFHQDGAEKHPEPAGHGGAAHDRQRRLTPGRAFSINDLDVDDVAKAGDEADAESPEVRSNPPHRDAEQGYPRVCVVIWLLLGHMLPP